MSLREEMWKYEQITGESAEHVPIIKLGAFPDGYEMGLKASEQTRWIPVSEGLPKAYEFVNCTCHSLIDDREDWVVETVYIPQPSDSPYSDWGNIPMLNSGDCEVVAWMHRDIPQPYEAESEDKVVK